MVTRSETPTWSTIEASAISGFLTRILLHPLDTCKVFAQVSGSGQKSTGINSSAMTIVRNDGITGLYRGFGPALIGTVPGVALYFTSFEMAKAKLERIGSERPNLVNFTAGFLAEVVSCIVWVPTDVLKERAQALNVGKTHGHIGSPSLRDIIHKEGFRGLYRGYGATLAAFGPFSAFYFMFAEQLKNVSRSSLGRPDLSFMELVSICAVAGGGAALCSAPMDLVKVRMQVERQNNSNYPGFLSALRQIFAKEGVRGLFRGGSSRVWFAVPNTAITMSIMESIKHGLD
jgi:hypothetical protein